MKLAWRKSGGAKHSLSWIPFKASGIAYAHCQIRYGKVWLSLSDSYGLKSYHLGPGSMSEGTRDRWTITIYATPKHKPMRQQALLNDSVGIDLGLREFAATGYSAVVVAQQFYRALEETLAIAQRANKNDEIKTIHAKIAHRRKDFQHKLGARLVQAYSAIFVGNVKPHPLRKRPRPNRFWTRAGVHSRPRCSSIAMTQACGSWKSMKRITQTCSGFQERTGPKGRGGLRIRAWLYGHCVTVQHRDINAARNILAAGHRRLVVGITTFPAHAAALWAECGEDINRIYRCVRGRKGRAASTSICCSMKNQLVEQREDTT